MARKRQSWRETPGYCSDSDEDESKTRRGRPPIEKLPITCITRPQKSYDHPVFKAISRANSHINSMTPEQIVRKLKELDLSDQGDLNVTSKRLKNWVRRMKMKEAKVELEGSGIDYIIVIDFEATCQRDSPAGFKQEIIEFPAVLINVENREIVSEFQSYCRPLINRVLSNYCTSLTGITQAKVDDAPVFPTVLKRFQLWLDTELKNKDKFVILTDGSWDIAKFLSTQCKISKVTMPHYFQTWSNIRRHFRNYYRVCNQNLEGMLNVLGMEFIGRPHSGMDDSRNIARIAVQLLHDGCDLFINETFG